MIVIQPEQKKSFQKKGARLVNFTGSVSCSGHEKQVADREPAKNKLVRINTVITITEDLTLRQAKLCI